MNDKLKRLVRKWSKQLRIVASCRGDSWTMRTHTSCDNFSTSIAALEHLFRVAAGVIEDRTQELALVRAQMKNVAEDLLIARSEIASHSKNKAKKKPGMFDNLRQLPEN